MASAWFMECLKTNLIALHYPERELQGFEVETRNSVFLVHNFEVSQLVFQTRQSNKVGPTAFPE